MIIQILGEEKGKLGSITSPEVMVQAKRDTAEMSKRVKKEGAADFKKSMAVLRKLIDSLERNSKMQKQQVEEKASVTAAPLFTIVTTMFSDARDNVTCSIFDKRLAPRHLQNLPPRICVDVRRENANTQAGLHFDHRACDVVSREPDQQRVRGQL